MIECPICGKEFEFLGSHIVQKHSMAIDDFKERHPNVPTAMEWLRERWSKERSERMKRFWRSEASKNRMKHIRELGRTRGKWKKGPKPKRPHIMVKCPTCGRDFETWVTIREQPHMKYCSRTCSDKNEGRKEKIRLQMMRKGWKSRLERRMEGMLKEIGVGYYWNQLLRTRIGTKFPDFRLRKYPIIIECDGGWHLKREIEDNQKDVAFMERGYSGLRFSGEEILTQEEKIKNIIIGATKSEQVMFRSWRAGSK